MIHAGAFPDELEFIIVCYQPVGLFDKSPQVVSIEQCHGLARIEDMRDAATFKILAMLQHGFSAIRCNNTKRHALCIVDLVQVTFHH